jgi:cell division protein FtsB
MRLLGFGRWVLRLTLAGVLAIVIGYLPYRVYGPQGVARVQRLEQDLRQLDEANRSLERKNLQLRLQIRSLKHDRHTIERVARDELGMVRPDDIVFQFQR